MRGRVVGVEGDRLDRLGARRAQRLDLAVELARVAGRQHHGARALGHQRAHRGQPDVRAAAQDEHALHRAERVLHAVASVRARTPARRPSRRARSERIDPAGSSLSRIELHSSELRVHRRQRVRAQARVLGQVDAAARAGDQLVEAVEQRTETRRGGRDVERQRPPRDRERQQPSPGPEALEHGQERRRSARGEPLDGGPQGVLGPERHDELVLQEAARAVHAVPAAHRVERDRSTGRATPAARAPAAGRLAELQLVEGRDRAAVQQPVRRPRGRGEPGRAGRRERALAPARRELVERRVIAAQ